jgi:Fur family ferric uptake transcriptional regulator
MGILDILKEKGHRLTPQRAMVVKILEESEGHISAEEIYSRLHDRYPYTNISTVYRTLELLKGLGLVTQTDLGEGIVRYHEAAKGHHHHLVCKGCGKVEDLPESALSMLQDKLWSDYQFRAELSHLAIFGYCQECLEKGKT